MAAAWPALLRLAATRFAIPPATFWRLSLVEWRALIEAPADPSRPDLRPLDRSDLNALLAAFPDDLP